MTTTMTISVRRDVPGMHAWPDASPWRGYLRTPHFHVFAFTVTIPVRHHGREIEMHDLGDTILAAVASLWPRCVDLSVRDFGDLSCEAIAERVARTLLERLEVSFVEVSVSEDPHHGATVRCAQ